MQKVGPDAAVIAYLHDHTATGHPAMVKITQRVIDIHRVNHVDPGLSRIESGEQRPYFTG
jgi:hypothetical protein